jgi:xylulokinase
MLLGLDLGTTNVKALIVDGAGGIQGQGSCPVELFYGNDGAVEQDLDQIWAATINAIRGALTSVDSTRVEAIGISTQGGALQLFDEQGGLQGRVVSWLDSRARTQNQNVLSRLGSDWFVQHIGRGVAGMAVGQLLRIREQTPEWLAPPRRIGFVGDTIVGRFCGRPAQDGTSAGLTLLYNLDVRCYDPELLKVLDISPSQLPDLLPAQAAAGRLSAEAAAVTGLRPGLPVSPAIHDQYTAALAAGAVRAGITMVGAGTAWVLLAISDSKRPPATSRAFTCHHVIEGLHGQILSLSNGGSAVAWILRVIGRDGIRDAELDQLLTSAPAGSHGLSFWPFLAGETPAGIAPGTRGCLANLQLSHTPTDMVRSVVEGLAYELNRHLVLLQKAGVPVEKLVLGGAPAASSVTPQILADVTGLPLACSQAPAASALGAAIVAQGLLEPERSLADIAVRMMAPHRLVKPLADRQLYAEGFEEYCKSIPRDEVS